MKVWIVRGGKYGEFEETALEKGLVCLGFNEVPNLKKAKSREAVLEIVRHSFPDASSGRISNFRSQLHAFVNGIEKGDLIVMPHKGKSQLSIGRATGEYTYRNDLGDIHHVRPVNWLRSDVARSELKPDLLRSMGAIMTVFQIKRNNAADRFKAVVDGRPDPGYQLAETEEYETDEVDVSQVDIEQVARDQIRTYIEENFKTHDLARLVDMILQAEGYVTHRSDPGPDNGVDILARRGSLGLEGPKLCVQVKSSKTAVDVEILRQLKGSMDDFKAEEGLLVSWGGFNRVVQKQARLSFFSVRLWDADDLITAIQRNYARLSEEVQKELPLKQVWTLVLEE